MAVAGGFCVPSVLNSCSTYVPAKLGGYHGRPLESGDRLPIGAKRIQSFSPTWSLNHDVVPLPASPCTLRILLESPQGTAHRALTNKPMHVWQIEWAFVSMNRCYHCRRLLFHEPSFQEQSSFRLMGSRFFFFCDAQTIGGYPVLGHIIAADLPRAAQLPGRYSLLL